MTSATDLRTLYNYNDWANEKLLAVVSQLTPEELTQPISGSYGSVRNTLVHILSAEWGWLDRCGGHPRGPALQAADYPNRTSLLTRWNEVESHRNAFLTNLTDDDLARPIAFTLANGPTQTVKLGELLHHAAIHAVHHRGQIALLLRALGKTPGNYDILFYYARHQGQ